MTGSVPSFAAAVFAYSSRALTSGTAPLLTDAIGGSVLFTTSAEKLPGLDVISFSRLLTSPCTSNAARIGMSPTFALSSPPASRVSSTSTPLRTTFADLTEPGAADASSRAVARSEAASPAGSPVPERVCSPAKSSFSAGIFWRMNQVNMRRVMRRMTAS